MWRQKEYKKMQEVEEEEEMQKEESMEKMLKDVWKMRWFRYPNWWTNSIYLNLVILSFSKSTFLRLIGLVGDQKLNKKHQNICLLSLEQQFVKKQPG